MHHSSWAGVHGGYQTTVEMGTSSVVTGQREARLALRHGLAESRSTGVQAAGGGSAHNDRPGQAR